MADQYGGSATPGFQAESMSQENQFLWGNADTLVLRKPIILLSSTVDAGASPTTQLRAGLALGQITATGKHKEYNPASTDGSQFLAGFLARGQNMLDSDGTAVDRVPPGGMIVAAPIVAGSVYGLDAMARRQGIGRFIFDDDLPGLGGNHRLVIAKTADYTVVNDTDNNVMFTNLGASGTVVFTLPATIKRGQRFFFYVEAGQTITVAAASGKLVTFNNAAATSVSLSTSSEKIGGMIEIVVNSDASKYLAILHTEETQTVTVA